MALPSLPIDDVLPQLATVLGDPVSATQGSAVLVAPTGAGKTTRTPGAIADSAGVPDGRVILLEPRRVAARAAARRIAAERGVRVGGEVGDAVAQAWLDELEDAERRPYTKPNEASFAGAGFSLAPGAFDPAEWTAELAGREELSDAALRIEYEARKAAHFRNPEAEENGDDGSGDDGNGGDGQQGKELTPTLAVEELPGFAAVSG